MKKTVLISLILLEFSLSTIGQTYRVFNVDASRFPWMKAQIWAVDSAQNFKPLTRQDIQIADNNELKSPLEFKSPRSSVIPSSIVLALDVSGSMEGVRFEMLKLTVAKFLENLPMEVTEVALATFSDNSYLLCDFTHDRNRLNQSLTKIFPEGGTSFNNAFLSDFYGALDISKMGKYKRVVIFLTDGLSSTNYNLVVQQAIHDSIQVNCLTVGLPIGEELVFIANETNGNYFSELNTPNDIQKAFETIYHQIQENTYGYLTWKANASCHPEKETVITLDKQPFHIKYNIPEKMVGSVQITPLSVTFNSGTPYKTQYKPVFVKGNNIDLHLTRLTNTNDSLFGYNNLQFPLITKANQWETVHLTFTPKDSIFAQTTYTIQSKNCPDQMLFASSTGKKKLKITEPVGDELFPCGTVIPVRWKGIDPGIPVDLYYQKEGTSQWCYLSTGVQLNHEVQAPSMDGRIRLMAQVTNNITLPNLMNSPVTIFSESEFNSVVFNDDGTELLSQSGKSTIQTWDVRTGTLKNNFENNIPGKASFYPKLNRVINISENHIRLFTNRNGMLIKDIPLPGKQTLTSFIFIKGKEFYTSALSYSNHLFWDPSLSFTVNDLPGGKNLEAAITPNTEFIVAREKNQLRVIKLNPSQRWFSIPVDGIFQKVVLHHSKNYLIVDQFHTCDLYELEPKIKVASWENQDFIQFDPSGNHLITQQGSVNFVRALKTGSLEWTLKATEPFQISGNGAFMAFYSNDSLKVVQLSESKIVYSCKVFNLKQFQFYPTKNLLIFRSVDSLTIVDYVLHQTVEKVKVEEDLVVDMEVSPDEESIAIVTPKIIALWKPGFIIDNDTSAFFQIIAPKPDVVEMLSFESQPIYQQVEKVFKKVISNSTNFPITIDSLVLDKSYEAFSLVSTKGPLVLEPKQWASVEIRCLPQSVGVVHGKIKVYSSIYAMNILLQGKSLQPSYELLTPVKDFGLCRVDANISTQIPVLKNTGNTDLSVSHPEIWPQSSGFSIDRPLTIKWLPPGDTLWMQVKFHPKNRGKQSGLLKIAIETFGQVSVSNLTGTGEAKRQVVVSGKTLHVKTLQPIVSKVICTELKSKRTVYRTESNSDGLFSMELPADLNYSLTAHVDGFFSSSENLDLVATQTIDTLYTQLLLSPVENTLKVVLNNIFFESGKAELLDMSQIELERLVTLLINNQELTLEVHGHTDNIGTEQENQHLSEQRAMSVKKYMETKGIQSHRIQIKYFGENKPLAGNETESGRKSNRRVEIIFIKPNNKK